MINFKKINVKSAGNNFGNFSPADPADLTDLSQIFKKYRNKKTGMMFS